jgi:acetoin utilization deacetylase AcuC-like enzyme
VQAAAPQHGLVYLDPDTAMNPFTLNAALRAAGAVVLATDLVLEGKLENAFCAIRPPGHHAESGRAMGFCLFNNVAVGVAHAIEKYGLKRVAIVDFDVHHGNGTEEIFHDDPRVMLCSTFQHPFYPHCGAESGNEHIINVPLPAGTDGEAFRKAVTERWLPALERFRPEMLFISAGFDAHREDDMAMFKLSEPDYAWVTQQLKDVAERHAQGRIVSVLEGGYELHALGRSVAAHIKVLSGL